MSIKTLAALTLAVLGMAPLAGVAETQEVERSTTVVGPGGRLVERSTRREPGRAEARARVAGPAGGQREVQVTRTPDSVERSVRVEGPGGASAERSVRVERGPGGLSREVHVEGPRGASLDRQLHVDRGARVASGFGAGPRVIERQSIIERPTVLAHGGRGFGYPPRGYGYPPPRGGSSFSFFFGGPVLPPPPPPVVVPVVPYVPAPVYAPPPVLVAPAVVAAAPPPSPPVVEVVEPQRYRTDPETIRVDPVVEALKRLRSRHDNSRRDGALTLGRLGDARAVPPLMQLLRFDEDADVRAAAAWALGEIGDPQADAYLRRAAAYDKKPKVRAEATAAVRRLVAPPPLPADVLDAEAFPEHSLPAGGPGADPLEGLPNALPGVGPARP